jgi:hypothetical protein
MRIEFTLTDEDGRNYQGMAELSAIAPRQRADHSQTRAAVELEAKGLPEHILAPREADFFREPRIPSEVHAKLFETYNCLLNRVQMALLRLQRKRELRKTVKRIGDKEHAAFVW